MTQTQANVAKLTPSTQDDRALGQSALEDARRSRSTSSGTPTIDPTQPQAITADAPIPVQIVQGGANTNAPATIATGEAAKQGSAETTQKASDKQGEDATTKDPITRIKELIDLQLAAAQVIQVKFSQAAYETELIKKNLSGITPQATASPPKIPGLKTGGETSPVQWVGEAGKELLVSPPRGSYVLNHRDAMSISGRALSPPKLAPIGSVSLPAIPTTMPKLDLPVLPGGNAAMIAKLHKIEQVLTRIESRPATPAINFNQSVDRGSYDQLVALRSLLINTRF